MSTSESKDDREKRISTLWGSLDVRKQGHIDFNGLKKSFRRIDHPLKNADAMLSSIIQTVDTNGDGLIDYSEFRNFVVHTEHGLWELFQSIDRNQNGEIDKNELKAAFSKADMTVSNAKLDEFFHDVDKNKDGVISYAEWRDFLLFLPAYSPPDIHALLSYFTATGNLNSEGDVHINDLHGIGTHRSFPTRFMQPFRALLYSIFSVRSVTEITSWTSSVHAESCGSPEPGDALEVDCVALDRPLELEWLPIPTSVAMRMSFRSIEQMLTEHTPQLGYFIAGGAAGVVSRTATAPLDRLKVYLIARSGAEAATARTTRDNTPLKMIKSASRTLIQAISELWRAGGIRSLFAGNGLNVVKVIPESAIKFGAYESAKRGFARLEGHNNPKRLLPTSQFLSGGIGGMVAQCFVYPLDTLKFQMQCEIVEGGLKGSRLIASTAKKLWTKHGLFGFFRGLPLGLAGMFPYAAIDLSTFEYLKQTLLARQARANHCHEDDIPLGNFMTGVIGATSGALSACVVYPLNVLRTRLQAQGTALHPATYNGIGDVARRTIKSEGVRGLYRGLTPNLLKVAPSVSISYITYENSKRMLGLAP